MIDRLRFWATTNRIGPDIPLTHWMLHFPTLGRWMAAHKLSFFGKDSFIRPYAYLVATKNISIGDRVIIRPNSMLMADHDAKIEIGDDVLIGSGVHVYVNDHKFDDTSKTIVAQGYYPSENVVISNNVWIGVNVVILKGVSIGEHSVIAAGSIVRENIDSHSVYGGVPAKKLRDLGRNI